MGNTTSYTAKLRIVDTLRADTPLEPLSENGFVWILAGQVSNIPGTINVDYPVWIKMSISELVSLPVYDTQGFVTFQTTIDPNGQLVGVTYQDKGILISIYENAFAASLNNGILTITSTGVLPPAGKTAQDLYIQHSTLAPQVPQVSTSDLLAEIIKRQSNPLDNRKLAENVTITVGQTTVVKCECVKKCPKDEKRKHCKKH